MTRKRIAAVAAILLAGLQQAAAQECAQDVLRDLYAELEAIDLAGEERLTQSLDRLTQQEHWTEQERSEFTLTIAESADVDAAESRRTDILARLFGLARRGDQHCTEMRELRTEALDIERTQWDAAVQHVEQRIWH
jgi:GTP1/Obg family GTP-binding protein